MMAGQAGGAQDQYQQQLIQSDIDRYNYGVNAPQDYLNQYISQLNNTPWSQNAKVTQPGPSGLQQGMQIAGSVASILGPLIAMCWVAREAYDGAPKWLRMRDWMLRKAPADLRKWYIKHGPAIAEWLRKNPEHKPAMRATMDRFIGAEA
jgi:hypothetical protein